MTTPLNDPELALEILGDPKKEEREEKRQREVREQLSVGKVPDEIREQFSDQLSDETVLDILRARSGMSEEEFRTSIHGTEPETTPKFDEDFDQLRNFIEGKRDERLEARRAFGAQQEPVDEEARGQRLYLGLNAIPAESEEEEPQVEQFITTDDSGIPLYYDPALNNGQGGFTTDRRSTSRERMDKANIPAVHLMVGEADLEPEQIELGRALEAFGRIPEDRRAELERLALETGVARSGEARQFVQDQQEMGLEERRRDIQRRFFERRRDNLERQLEQVEQETQASLQQGDIQQFADEEAARIQEELEDTTDFINHIEDEVARVTYKDALGQRQVTSLGDELNLWQEFGFWFEETFKRESISELISQIPVIGVPLSSMTSASGPLSASAFHSVRTQAAQFNRLSGEILRNFDPEETRAELQQMRRERSEIDDMLAGTEREDLLQRAAEEGARSVSRPVSEMASLGELGRRRRLVEQRRVLNQEITVRERYLRSLRTIEDARQRARKRWGQLGSVWTYFVVGMSPSYDNFVSSVAPVAEKLGIAEEDIRSFYEDTFGIDFDSKRNVLPDFLTEREGVNLSDEEIEAVITTPKWVGSSVRRVPGMTRAELQEKMARVADIRLEWANRADRRRGRAAQLLEAGQTEQARELVLDALALDRAASMYGDSNFAYTWVTHPEREELYYDALADAAIQKYVQTGEWLTDRDKFELKERFVDPWNELAGEVASDMALLLPEAAWEVVARGAIGAVKYGGKGILQGVGAAADIIPPFAQGADLVRYLFRQSHRSIARNLETRASDTFRLMARRGATQSLGDVNSMQNVLETASRYVVAEGDEAAAIADELPLIGQTHLEHLKKVSQIFTDIDMSRVHPRFQPIVESLQPENWARTIEELHARALEDARQRLYQEFRPQVDAGEKTQQWLRETVERNAREYADNPRNLDQYWAERINQAYQAVHSPVRAGSTLVLEDDAMNKILQGLHWVHGKIFGKSAAETSTFLKEADNLVLNKTSTFFNNVRRTWTELVLSARVGWTMINLQDSQARMMLEGESIFDDWGTLLTMQYEEALQSGLVPEELMQTFMRGDLDRAQEVGSRLLRGERPTAGPLGFINYEWRRLSQEADLSEAGVIGKAWDHIIRGYKSWIGGWHDTNSAIEFTLRLRLFGRKYASKFEMTEAVAFANWLDDLAARGLDADEQQFLIGLWRQTGDNPEQMRQVMQDMITKHIEQGNPLWSAFMPPDMNKALSGLSPLERANVVNSVKAHMKELVGRAAAEGRALQADEVNELFDMVKASIADELADASSDKGRHTIREIRETLTNDPDFDAQMPDPDDVESAGAMPDLRRGVEVERAQEAETAARQLTPQEMIQSRASEDVDQFLQNVADASDNFADFEVTDDIEGLAQTVFDNETGRARIRLSRELLEAEPDQVADVIRNQLQAVLERQDEILIDSAFDSTQRYRESLQRFLDDPDELANARPDDFEFIARQLEAAPSERKVLEGLSGKKLSGFLDPENTPLDDTTEAGRRVLGLGEEDIYGSWGQRVSPHPGFFRAGRRAKFARGKFTSMADRIRFAEDADVTADAAQVALRQTAQDIGRARDELFHWLIHDWPGPLQYQYGVGRRQRWVKTRQIQERLYNATANWFEELGERAANVESLEELRSLPDEISIGELLQRAGFRVDPDEARISIRNLPGHRGASTARATRGLIGQVTGANTWDDLFRPYHELIEENLHRHPDAHMEDQIRTTMERISEREAEEIIEVQEGTVVRAAEEPIEQNELIDSFTRERFRQSLTNWGLESDQVDALVALEDGNARVYAQYTGRSKTEYYVRTYADIVVGGEAGESALFQRGRKSLDEWLSYYDEHRRSGAWRGGKSPLQAWEEDVGIPIRRLDDEVLTDGDRTGFLRLRVDDNGDIVELQLSKGFFNQGIAEQADMLTHELGDLIWSHLGYFDEAAQVFGTDEIRELDQLVGEAFRRFKADPQSVDDNVRAFFSEVLEAEPKLRAAADNMSGLPIMSVEGVEGFARRTGGAEQFIEQLDSDMRVAFNQFVADSDRPAIEIAEEIVAGASPLEQRLGDDILGSTEFLEDGRALVRASESADVSTALHEFTHSWVNTLQRIADDAPMARRDLEIMEEFLEAEVGLTKVDGAWTREMHEEIARRKERYFREGNAPTPALQGIFERFRQWMTDVYEKLRGSPLHGKKVEGTPLQEVFDRWTMQAAEPFEALDTPAKIQRIEESVVTGQIHQLPTNAQEAVRDQAQFMGKELGESGAGSRIWGTDPDTGKFTVVDEEPSTRPEWYRTLRYGTDHKLSPDMANQWAQLHGYLPEYKKGSLATDIADSIERMLAGEPAETVLDERVRRMVVLNLGNKTSDLTESAPNFAYILTVDGREAALREAAEWLEDTPSAQEVFDSPEAVLNELYGGRLDLAAADAGVPEVKRTVLEVPVTEMDDTRLAESVRLEARYMMDDLRKDRTALWREATQLDDETIVEQLEHIYNGTVPSGPGLPRWEGDAWRAGGSAIPSEASAADVVRHEVEELGNELDVPDNILRQLEEVDGDNLVWVTKSEEDALRFAPESPEGEPLAGEVFKADVGPNPVILARDGEGGFLVLRNAGLINDDLQAYDRVRQLIQMNMDSGVMDLQTDEFIRAGHPHYHRLAGTPDDQIEDMVRMWDDMDASPPSVEEYVSARARTDEFDNNAKEMWSTFVLAEGLDIWPDEVLSSPDRFRAFLTGKIDNMAEEGYNEFAPETMEAMDMLLQKVDDYLNLREDYGWAIGLEPSQIKARRAGRATVGLPEWNMPRPFRQWLRHTTSEQAKAERVLNAVEQWRQYLLGKIDDGTSVFDMREKPLERLETMQEAVEAGARMKDDAVDVAIHGDTGDEIRFPSLAKGMQDQRFGHAGLPGALEETNWAMLDYSTYNHLDNVIRSYVPFWMFPSRSIPYWIEKTVMNPLLTAAYSKYQSFSRALAYQHGAVTSTGDQLPSLESYIPIPGTRMWFNPTAPISMRYVMELAAWGADEVRGVQPRYDVDEQDQEQKPLTSMVQSMMEGMRLFGIYMGPWADIPIRAAFPEATKGIPQFSLIPQTELIPSYWRRSLVDMAQRIPVIGPSIPDGNLSPDVRWKDYLIEREMLEIALQEIQSGNLSEDEKEALIQDVKAALGYRKVDDPNSIRRFELMPREDHELWLRARRQVESRDLEVSWIGYFTGVYPKEHTDARAKLLELRDDINQLRDALNSEVGRDLFFPDMSAESLYDFYIDKRYETSEGWIRNLYGTISWTQTPGGEQAYGLQRRQIVAANLHQETMTDQYYATLFKYVRERDRQLQTTPIGDSEARSQVWQKYFSNVERLENDPKYDAVNRAWVAGNKPDELILEDFRNKFYYLMRSTKPVYRPEQESFPDYRQRVEEWREELPTISKAWEQMYQTDLILDMMPERTRLVEVDGGYVYMSEDTGLPEWVARGASLIEDMPEEFPIDNSRMLRLQEWSQRMTDEFDEEALDAWDKANDSPGDALNRAWEAMVWDPLWDIIGGDMNNFYSEVAQQEFLAKADQVSFSELVNWVQEEYPGRWSRSELEQWARGGILEPSERIGPETELQEMEDDIWAGLTMLPPGEARNALNDELDRLMDFGSSRLTLWYENQSDSFKDEASFKEFYNNFMLALNNLDLEQPTQDELLEFGRAKELDDAFDQMVDERFGETFLRETMGPYWNLDPIFDQEERENMREADPRIELYNELNEQYAVDNPLWAKYFKPHLWEDIQAGELGEDSEGTVSGGSGRGSGGAGRGSTGTRTIRQPGSTSRGTVEPMYLPMGARGTRRPEFGQLGRGGVAGQPWWPAGLAETIGGIASTQIQALIDESQPLPTQTVEYLTRVAERHPEFEDWIQTILDANDDAG